MDDQPKQYIVTVFRDATIPYRAIFTAIDAAASRRLAEEAWWQRDVPKVTWVEDGLSEHDSYDIEDLEDIEPATEEEVEEHAKAVEAEKNPPEPISRRLVAMLDRIHAAMEGMPHYGAESGLPDFNEIGVLIAEANK